MFLSKLHFCSCQLRLAINPGERWNILKQILRLLCLARLQESAHWLAVRGRLIEARIVLEHMAKKNGTLGISKSFDKFTDLTSSWDKSSFHHPRKAHILRKLGPPPSYDLSLLYNVTGITARQTSRDWSANFLNSLHSNQAVWICLISFKIFSSIKLQGEEPKLGRNAKVIVRMSQVMNPLMLLPLKSSGHASGREVLAWIRAFKCFYHLFIMSASCHHRVMCITWTGLNQESLPPRHHSVQFQTNSRLEALKFTRISGMHHAVKTTRILVQPNLLKMDFWLQIW